MNSFKHGLTRTDHDVTDDRSTPVVFSQSAIAPTWSDTGGQRGSTLASFLEIPFMNKRLIFCCTLLGILLGWALLLVWPRSYESVAKLMVKVGRESVSLDPTATTGSSLLMLQKTQEEEIISALEVLNSRQVSEKVVDALGADAILDGELPQTEQQQGEGAGGNAFSQRLELWKTSLTGWVSDVLLTAGVKDNISDRELAIRRLQKSVETHTPRKSSVVVIEAQAATPELAQAIVSKVTESFLAEHLEGSHTDGSYEFFEEQCVTLESELNELVAARAKFMQDHQIVSIQNNRELLSSQFTGIDRDLVVALGQAEQAAAEVDDVKAKMLAVEDEIVAEKTAIGDETWSGMRQQIYELELEEQNLAANFTVEHPRLRRVRSQLKGAREILDKLDSERIDENTTPNPIKMRLKEELQQKQTQVVGLRSLIQEQQERRKEMELTAKELLDHERHLTQVDREIELKTASLSMMRRKLEEARMIDELHSDKFSNIHVFQPATFVERAVSPKKRVLGVGFLFLGLLSGLALSFLREGSSPSLRTPGDVESRLGAPVVSTIPRLKRMKSPRLKEQKSYRKLCQGLISEILMSQHRSGHTRGRSLGVIGVDVGAGASTLAVNLAVASSVDCHMRTVLVDADARMRSVSKMFGLNGAPGLVELVSGSASHDECLQKVNKPEIELIASSADSCDELLSNSAPEIVQALQAYLHDCDLLIVDLPAASQPDQAVALAQHLDCILVVIESEKTQAAAAERMLNRLAQSDTEIIGVVLTKTRSYLPKFVRGFVARQA